MGRGDARSKEASCHRARPSNDRPPLRGNPCPSRVQVRVEPDAARQCCGSMSSVSRVLIVDDHDGFRSAARALLEEDGYTVVGEVRDGREAIDAVRKLRPDVVLLDVQLPGEDGFSVCEQLVTDAAAPTVVLVSGL